MKKKIFAGASSGILASMLILGAGNVYADTSADSTPTEIYTPGSLNRGMHMMHRFNSVTKVHSLATQLGISEETVRNELQSGKSVKQILLDHGITGVELQKAFSHKEKKNAKGWKKNQ